MHVSSPAVLTEHLSKQSRQPVLQTGSHSPASLGWQLAMAPVQGRLGGTSTSDRRPCRLFRPFPPCRPFQLRWRRRTRRRCCSTGCRRGRQGRRSCRHRRSGRRGSWVENSRRSPGARPATARGRPEPAPTARLRTSAPCRRPPDPGPTQGAKLTVLAVVAGGAPLSLAGADEPLVMSTIAPPTADGGPRNSAHDGDDVRGLALRLNGFVRSDVHTALRRSSTILSSAVSPRFFAWIPSTIATPIEATPTPTIDHPTTRRVVEGGGGGGGGGGATTTGGVTGGGVTRSGTADRLRFRLGRRRRDQRRPPCAAPRSASPSR